MKEIGGYFSFERLINDEYHHNLIRINTARNALLYILKAKEIKKVYLPYFLCNSVSEMLHKNGYEFEHYKINDEFMPQFNGNIQNNECLYVVNYYGQLSNEKVTLLKQKFNQIILDNTHAFFQKPLSEVDTLYSCRKFFGVPDGAYLSTNKKIGEQLEVDASSNLRMKHLLGRFEGKASDYYSNFQEAERLFKVEPLKYMSEFTQNILGAIDYENVRQIRNRNYSFLESELKNSNKLSLVVPDGAFAYPLYIENGMEIRKRVIKRNIYIPTLWPNVLENMSAESLEYKWAANILPLPCDQRYTIEDMEYIINCLQEVKEFEKVINT